MAAQAEVVRRSHNADDSGGFARIASRHAALSGRMEVQARQRENSRISEAARRKPSKDRLWNRLRMFPFSHGILEFRAMVKAGLI